MTIIYSSDGSNSHPRGEGPAGAAFVVNGAKPRYFLLERGSNNEAEMYGLAMAIAEAGFQTDDGSPVEIHTDSQWCAYIVAGYLKLSYLPHYALSKKNEDRFTSLLQTIELNWQPNFTLKWVPRKLNREADRAANVARERAIEKYGHK